MAARTFQVEVLTPEGEVFNDEVEMVSTRTDVGSIGILANHQPLLGMLDPTELRLYRSETDIVRFAQGEGYVQVADDRVLDARRGGDPGRRARHRPSCRRSSSAPSRSCRRRRGHRAVPRRRCATSAARRRSSRSPAGAAPTRTSPVAASAGALRAAADAVACAHGAARGRGVRGMPLASTVLAHFAQVVHSLRCAVERLSTRRSGRTRAPAAAAICEAHVSR